MNMNVTYWLDREDKERCFQILRRGTAFENEHAYITAYEICKGLNEYYSDDDSAFIPLRDAHTGKLVIEVATVDSIDKMITWLREKHDIFYFQAMNLCIPLEDPLSMRVKKFWESEDDRHKQMEEYCKNDVAMTASDELASVKKERDELKKRCDNLAISLNNLKTTVNSVYGLSGGYACSGCQRTTCGYFTEILSSLGIKEMHVVSGRRESMSNIEVYAKAANERAQVIFNEHQSMLKQIDELNERIYNQEQIIKTQNESLTKQRKQLNDLGASLRDIKEVVDREMDDLMAQHGDDIIPVF